MRASARPEGDRALLNISRNTCRDSNPDLVMRTHVMRIQVHVPVFERALPKSSQTSTHVDRHRSPSTIHRPSSQPNTTKISYKKKNHPPTLRARSGVCPSLASRSPPASKRHGNTATSSPRSGAKDPDPAVTRKSVCTPASEQHVTYPHPPTTNTKT